ncbi:leishmanolysin-like peptidase [Lepeophtheirus salmonis]|uniref:leishmanolysin-like peptidase n=1 Tax=Lepeophtheirus salmonis TaxID=72036 RepID=UPI001AE87B60|nr:leishmanolysin-like peptidase [Lepeophtheirus salmonis]
MRTLFEDSSNWVSDPYKPVSVYFCEVDSRSIFIPERRMRGLGYSRVFFILCSSVILLHSSKPIVAHGNCRHHYPKADEVQHVHLEDHHSLRKRSLDQNLRIKLYYDGSVYKLAKEQFELINNTVLPQAVAYWSKALRVRKTENKIRLNRKCEHNQVFFKSGDPRPYCKNKCEAATMCGEVQVPEDHLEVCLVCNSFGQDCRVKGPKKPSPGIHSSDFVFYISAMETERCQKGMTVAYAAHCQQEAALDRPIAGHANLCPSSISTKRQELDILLSTVKHEMLHALGFSVSLFAFYRDKNGEPLTPRGENGKPELNEELQTRQWSERVIKREVRQWRVRGMTVEKEVQVVVTPRVQEEVRAHYGCHSLSGAELEDQGEEGTALTHWEKRLFENEAMTGTHTQNPIYSRITLALMEDTGWYKPNYEMADDLKWGRGLGCEFVNNSCLEWMKIRQSKGKSIHPYCNKVKRDPLETECTDDRSSVALCNLVQHNDELPPYFQNFDNIPHIANNDVGYYGGSVALADYCPYIQEFTWRSNNVVVRGSHCMYPENNPVDDRNFALETYSPGSKCFDHTDRMWEERTCEQVRQWQHWGSGCYQYACEDGRLHIHVYNYTFTCYFKGQEIPIYLEAHDWLHTGAVVCPSCEEMCGTDFTSRGEKCLPGSMIPKTHFYTRHNLNCRFSSGAHSPLSLRTLIVLLIGIKYLL